MQKYTLVSYQFNIIVLILIFKNLLNKISLLDLRTENFRNVCERWCIDFGAYKLFIVCYLLFTFFFFLYFLSQRLLKILILSFSMTTDWMPFISSYFCSKRN